MYATLGCVVSEQSGYSRHYTVVTVAGQPLASLWRHHTWRCLLLLFLWLLLKCDFEFKNRQHFAKCCRMQIASARRTLLKRNITTFSKNVVEWVCFIKGHNFMRQQYLAYKLIIPDSDNYITKVHPLQ